MHQEQPRRNMALPLRACCSLQSPCLSLTAALVFFTICAFHVHRLTASDSLPLEAGLHKLVMPGSLHASDPPLASPVDARSVAHHARMYGDSAFSHHVHGEPLYSTLQSSRLHSLAPNLFPDRTPRALMRSSDRLYPVESHPIHSSIHDSFPLGSERAKYMGDDQILAPRTHAAISDSLHSSVYPQHVSDTARSDIHQIKQLQTVEQEAPRRHPVIEAFHSIIGGSPPSKTLDTDMQSSSEKYVHLSHPDTALIDTSRKPAGVSVTDLATSNDGAQAVLESESKALVETDSEKTINIAEEEQLQHGRPGSSSGLSSEAQMDEASNILRESVGVDASRVEAEAKPEVSTIASNGKYDEHVNHAPSKSGFLSFLWGTSRSKQDVREVKEEKEAMGLDSVVKKDERESFEDDLNLLADESIEKDNEVEAS